MGSVGKGVERGVQGVANPLGLGKTPEMGTGGQFKASKTAMSAEELALQQLKDKISGKTSTVSELQYKQALDDLVKNQQSAVASSRGVSNTGLAQRNAMQVGAQANLDIGRESAAAKLAEMNQAQQMILNQASAQRGVAAQSAAANLQAQSQQQRNMQDIIGRIGGAAATPAAGGGGGGAAATSDENLKENIKPSNGDASKVISEFMDALKSYTYEYKNKSNNGIKNPDGEVTSVMAQDLEKSSVGKRAVKEGPDGKSVDYAQLMAPMLASMAEINKRLKKVEGK